MSKPLRIAWLGHRSTQLGGGMATYSTEITTGLRKRGYHVTFFHHGLGGEPNPAGTAVADESVELDSVSLVKPIVYSRPRAKQRLLDRLQSRDFDLVHASFWFSSLDFDLPKTCIELGIPIVATFHVAFDRRHSIWGGITNATYRLYAPALSDCDRVIVFGEAQKQTLVDLGVPDDRLVILPNGVDVNKYRPGETDWKQRLQAERLFAYMGRVDAEKNVDVLLDAFSSAGPAAGTKLAIIGSGTERKRLQRQFRDPRIQFLGHVSDEASRIGILRATDAFFLPSAVEGLSLSMLEAMACGAATIATDVGGDGDALRGAGIVLDPSNLREELGLAVRQMIELPWLSQPLGELARQRVLDRFSLEQNLDSLTRIYSEIAPA